MKQAKHCSNGQKSGSRIYKHQKLLSLRLEDKYPDIKYGIKFGYKNIGFNGKFYTFPYFLTFLLKRFVSDRKKNI